MTRRARGLRIIAVLGLFVGCERSDPTPSATDASGDEITLDTLVVVGGAAERNPLLIYKDVFPEAMDASGKRMEARHIDRIPAHE